MHWIAATWLAESLFVLTSALNKMASECIHTSAMHYSICFIWGALLSIAFAQTRQYYFVGSAQTWTNAQSVCRRDYTDLATIENLADVDAVLRTNASYSGRFLTLTACLNISDTNLIFWIYSIYIFFFYKEKFGEIQKNKILF